MKKVLLVLAAAIFSLSLVVFAAPLGDEPWGDTPVAVADHPAEDPDAGEDAEEANAAAEAAAEAAEDCGEATCDPAGDF